MTTWTTSGACTDCGAPATCRYDYGTGLRYACPAHDPLRPGLTASVRVPPFYQSLPLFPVTVTSGHGFGAPACNCAYGAQTAICPVHPPVRPVVTCTCPSAWGGLCPPPACPAHGQTEMIQVRC